MYSIIPSFFKANQTDLDIHIIGTDMDEKGHFSCNKQNIFHVVQANQALFFSSSAAR
jgi:hypothetical protein